MTLLFVLGLGLWLLGSAISITITINGSAINLLKLVGAILVLISPFLFAGG